MSRSKNRSVNDIRTEIYNDIFKKKDTEWLSAKAKIKYTDDYGTQRAIMHLRLKSDSLVWMVIKKYSLEAARILINKDSLFVVYRLDKSYQKEDLDSIANIYGFYPEFDFLQNTLWGSLPSIDSSVHWQEKVTDTSFEFRSMLDDVLIDFSYDKTTAQLRSGRFMDKYNLEGTWDYSDYRTVHGFEIPFERKFHINFDDDSFIDLEIKFLEIDVGKAYELRFDIPDHYSRISY